MSSQAKPPFEDLGPGKHLVLDHATVADTYRLRRRVHQPRREPTTPVMEPELPWEGQGIAPVHVMFDSKRGLWRMWYEADDPVAAQQRRAMKPGLEGNIGEPQPSYLCYAESADGVEWRRPELGIYQHQGRPTNICFKGFSGAQGGSVHLMPDAPEGERWLLVNLDWFSVQSGGLCFAYSPDGIHWAYKEQRPVIFGESDTRNCMLYNPERGVYMMYMRAWHAAAVGWITEWVGGRGVPRRPTMSPEDAERHARMQREAGLPVGGKNPRRRVAYSESADLRHWSESQIILTPDELDTDDFYGMCPFRYADYYLGQLWVHDDVERESIDVELAFSRDGVNWSRLPERPKFIPTGEPGEPDGYMVLPAQQPVVTDEAIYVYWGAEGRPHDVGGGRRVAFRGRLRPDGFISLSADRRLGALVTRPFVLQSDHIEMNAATYGGEIVAELTEPDGRDVRGRPIEGFTADDFDVFTGDSVNHRLSWRGSSDLSALKGRRLMLRMSLFHADLYSFTL